MTTVESAARFVLGDAAARSLCSRGGPFDFAQGKLHQPL